MSDVLILNADGTPLSYVPLSTTDWQDAMRLVFLEKVRVIKEYENWVIRSQYVEIKVPSIVIMVKQVKHVKNPKYSRSNIYLRDDFTCQLQITGSCRDVKGKVNLSELTLDHVVPKSIGGTTSWINVCTSCKNCNGVKGDNANIVPRKMPKKPSYYEILSKRRSLPIYIKDPEWAYYIDWKPDLIKVLPQNKCHG